MSKRLIFPCGAYFPLKDGEQSWMESAHRHKDGSFRFGVYPSTSPFADEEWNNRWKKWGTTAYVRSDGERHAPCMYGCPTPKRRNEQMGYDAEGNLGEYVSCHARLFVDGQDVTPPRPAKCPHCEEQKTYVQACMRAAKTNEDAPDRARWRKCPSCEQYRELTTDTGLCATCELVKVVEANR